jgi:hypothetical protein
MPPKPTIDTFSPVLPSLRFGISAMLSLIYAPNTPGNCSAMLPAAPIFTKFLLFILMDFYMSYDIFGR